MSEDKAPGFWRIGNPMLWGVGVTVLFAGVAVWMAFMPVGSCAASCETKWAHFLKSTPNEVGDTLAGFAGVLAFIWIIVTVWLQSQELSEQRKELVNQREEMEGQRRASEEMAKAMTIQAEIFKKEQDDREKAENDRTVEELIRRLRTELPLAALRWSEQVDGYGNQPSININPWAGSPGTDKADDVFFIGYAMSFRDKFASVKSMAQSEKSYSKPKESQLDTVQGLLVMILGMRPISAAMQQRVVSLRLANLEEQVRSYRSADIWRAEDEGDA